MKHLVVVILLLGLVPAAFAIGEPSPEAIELAFARGVFTDLDSNLRPVRHGPLTLRISSPEHRLTVHRNRLELARRDDGALDVTLEVELDGEGRIVADIESGATTNRLEDEVTAPRQTVIVEARARLTRTADGLEGYLWTVEEAPESVDLEIRSGLGERFLAFCQALARVPLFAIDCSGFESAFSSVAVPLPGPGEQVLLPDADLTEAERAFFDRFLTTPRTR